MQSDIDLLNLFSTLSDGVGFLSRPAMTQAQGQIAVFNVWLYSRNVSIVFCVSGIGIKQKYWPRNEI